MPKRTRTPIAWALAFALVALVAQPASAQYSMNEFAAILIEAAGETQHLKVETEDGTVPTVSGVKPNGDGQWEVSINHAVVYDYTANIFPYPADLKYDAVTGVVEYSFEGSLITFEPAADVIQHKGFQKSIKAWTGKYKDLNMTVDLGDSEVLLKANYNISGAKKGDILKRLESLFVASNGVVVWTEVCEKKVEEEFIEKVDKLKLTYMNQAAFEELATVARTEENTEQRDGVKEGAWKMSSVSYSGRRTGLNYGDRVVLEYIPGTAMLTNEERGSLMPVIEKWVRKNKIKKAQTAVKLTAGDPSQIVVTATVPMDGKIKGKDFRKIVEDWQYEWSGDLGYELWEPMGPFLESFEGETFERIDNWQLQRALSADYSVWQRAAPDGAQGYWVMVSDGWKNSITKRYVVNYGDRIEITYGKPLLERSRDDAVTVQALATQWLAGKSVEKTTLADPVLVESDLKDIGSMIFDTTHELQVTMILPVAQFNAGEIYEANSAFNTLKAELDAMLNEKLGISEW